MTTEWKSFGPSGLHTYTFEDKAGNIYYDCKSYFSQWTKAADGTAVIKVEAAKFISALSSDQIEELIELNEPSFTKASLNLHTEKTEKRLKKLHGCASPKGTNLQNPSQ